MIELFPIALTDSCKYDGAIYCIESIATWWQNVNPLANRLCNGSSATTSSHLDETYLAFFQSKIV